MFRARRRKRSLAPIGLLMFLPLSLHAQDFSYTWLEGGTMRIVSGYVDDKGLFADGSYALGSHMSISGAYFHSASGSSTYCVSGYSLSKRGNPFTIICSNSDVARQDSRVGVEWHSSFTARAELTVDLNYVKDAFHEGSTVTPLIAGSKFNCVYRGGSIFNYQLICLGGGVQDETSNGFNAAAGVRYRVADPLELDGTLGYEHLSQILYPGSTGPVFHPIRRFVRGTVIWDVTEHWHALLDVTRYFRVGNDLRFVGFGDTELRAGVRYSF